MANSHIHSGVEKQARTKGMSGGGEEAEREGGQNREKKQEERQQGKVVSAKQEPRPAMFEANWAARRHGGQVRRPCRRPNERGAGRKQGTGCTQARHEVLLEERCAVAQSMKRSHQPQA